MDSNYHTQPHVLERYAFVWSQLRLVIAAIALFLGGVPPIWFIIKSPVLIPLTGLLLTACWIISGIAAVYLLYRWYKHGQMLFGHNNKKDTVAFFIACISGINLGLAGLTHNNIGMSLMSGKIVFYLTGLVYLWAAYRLYQRWQSNSKKIF